MERTTAAMANDELADLYCSLCAEYFHRVRLAKSPDRLFASDLEGDIKQVHGLIAARGMFDTDTASLLADGLRF